MKRTKLFILFVLSLIISVSAQELNDKFVKDMLEAKDVDITGFRFTLMIDQPLDYEDPSKGTFKQRVFVKHVGFDKPVVIHTRGYNARPGARNHELSRILNCNEIEVEHRFFGPSRPASVNWDVLTVKNAANDHHRIVEMFKKYYTGKWINTGISKGGQTALLHRFFFPEDVDVTVAYVAPINLEENDERIYSFLEDSVSTQEKRDVVIKLQRALLERRDEIIPMIKENIDAMGLTFKIGFDLAYEMSVLESYFSYWQYQDGDVSKLPAPDAPAKDLYRFLMSTNPFLMFADQSNDALMAAMVQNYRELGFYGYKTEGYRDLLKFAKGDFIDNKMLVADSIKVEYDGTAVNAMNKWLKEEGNEIIYIYGGQDIWSATMFIPTDKTNALLMIKEGAAHGANIRSFKGEKRETILTTLEKWLDLKINRRRIR
ncbi:MAG: S28 family serine protease [Rhodothermaceae bacterium]